MANVFNCSACGEKISADVAAGQQVQCPLCSQVVVVPEDAGPLAAATETLPYSSVPGGAYGGQLSQGMAIGSLVCGIVGLGCLPVGIVGIVLGIVALVRISREPNRYKGTGMAVGGICTGVVGLLTSAALMIAVTLPSLSRARELSKRTICAANLRAIGSAILQYAADENNVDAAFPDDLNKLVTAGSVTSQQFTCPSDALSANSYHYIPGYSVTNVDPAQVIMYEDPGIHGGEGGNVLFADGHVTFEKSQQLQKLIDAITLPDGRPYDPDAD